MFFFKSEKQRKIRILEHWFVCRLAAQFDVFWRQPQRCAHRRPGNVRHRTQGRQRDSEYHLLRFRSSHVAPVDAGDQVRSVANKLQPGFRPTQRRQST